MFAKRSIIILLSVLLALLLVTGSVAARPLADPPGTSFTYQGKLIDLDPLVEEQVLLALPAYPVCEEGCKGLCPVCGQNQNEKACGCDRHVPDPRWAGLAKFRRE